MKLKIRNMTKAALLSLTLLASTTGHAIKVDLANNVPSQIVTNSKEEYYKVKNSIMTNMINNMDFSEIDLKSNFKYFSKNLEAKIEHYSYDINGDRKIATCEYLYDQDYYVISSGNSLITITDMKNKSKKSESFCLTSYLEDEREVNVFKNPHKDSFKKLLIESLDMQMKHHMTYEKKGLLDSKVVFNIDKEGFVATYENGDEFKRHTSKPINHDFLFAEDMYYLKNLSPVKIGALDLNKPINTLFYNDFSYIGESTFWVQAFYHKFYPEKIKSKRMGYERYEGISLQELFIELDI